jgi:hypothetical protein
MLNHLFNYLRKGPDKKIKSMFFKRILVLVMVSSGLLRGYLFGQKYSIETQFDTNLISIGDQVNLTYKLIIGKDIQVKLPVYKQKLTEGVEIIGVPVIDSTNNNKSQRQVTLNLIITSFDTGIYYLPPQPFVISSTGYSDTVFSKATYLEVNGVPIDTTKTIRDIKAPESAPVTLMELLPYWAAFSVLAFIVIALLLFYRKKKRYAEGLKPLKPAEPPYVTALRELDKIKTQKLWQQKQVKEYYTRLTYVIRWYISKRFNISALEQTSDEILDHLRSLKLDHVNYIKLENLLNLADLVKFAKGEPNPDENIKHLDNAYDFIMMTKENSSESNTQKLSEGNNN